MRYVTQSSHARLLVNVMDEGMRVSRIGTVPELVMR